MEDCGINDRDFYWFNSHPQTTVDAMMEAEVNAEVNAITSAIVSGVVDAEVIAKRTSDSQQTTEPDKQDSKDTPDKMETPPDILQYTKRDHNYEQEKEEALVTVARVVEETCNQIERHNRQSNLPSLGDNNSKSTDCNVAMDVDQSAAEQPAKLQVEPKNNYQQECAHQNASNLKPISGTQVSSSSQSVAVAGLVSPDNNGLETPKADKSAELDDDIEYVVENILDKKSDSNGLAKFLVKWENYPSDSNSWEPVENLVDCEKVMTKYELRRAERLAKMYGPHSRERPPKGGVGGGASGGQRDKHKVYKVVDIMGLTVVKEEKYFLVSLADDMGSTFIRSSLAHRLFPSKVIDFYMRHIKWKSSAARS